MDKLKAFETFAAVATKGSLTAAARAEGVAPAIIGRRLILPIIINLSFVEFDTCCGRFRSHHCIHKVPIAVLLLDLIELLLGWQELSIGGQVKSIAAAWVSL